LWGSCILLENHRDWTGNLLVPELIAFCDRALARTSADRHGKRMTNVTRGTLMGSAGFLQRAS
jgi:hypothetical protein